MVISTEEYIKLAKLSALAAILEILNKNNRETLANRTAKPGDLDLAKLGADYWRVFPLIEIAMEDYHDRRDKAVDQ